MEKDNLRPVKWNDSEGTGETGKEVNAWFHGFFTLKKALQNDTVTALIELENGELRLVDYFEIQFADRITPPYHKKLT